MPEAKRKVQELLNRLPDDCSIEDVLYHLYVISKIEEGLAAADAGQTIPQEVVEEEMRKKWLYGAE